MVGRTPDIGKWATAQKLHDVWFTARRFRQGYDETEVDSVIDTAQSTLLAYEAFVDKVKEATTTPSINGDGIRLKLQSAISELEKAKTKGSL